MKRSDSAAGTRHLLTRIVELDTRIRRREFPNCTSFAREYEVSSKTVQRDLEFLRDSFHAPLAYDTARRGYFYEDESWSLPLVSIAEGELLQVLLAARMADQFPGSPLGRSLENIFQKICARLRDPVVVDPILLRKQVSFHGGPSRPIGQSDWMALFHGLRTGKVVRFLYHPLGRDAESERTAEPLHLACVEGDWYLVAFDQQAAGLRNYAVSRMRNVVVTLDDVSPREFDAETYCGRRFGRFFGEPLEEVKVRLRVTPHATQWMRETNWHPRQKMIPQKDGGMRLEFPAPARAMLEVKRWVLGWGAEVEVLAPASLRAEVLREARAMAGLPESAV